MTRPHRVGARQWCRCSAAVPSATARRRQSGRAFDRGTPSSGAAVRAGIGESLYAMDSPWLRVGGADGQLRANRAGKPYLDERTSRRLARMYEAWLTRAGSIFGDPSRTPPRRRCRSPATRPPTSRPPRTPTATATGPAARTRATPTTPIFPAVRRSQPPSRRTARPTTTASPRAIRTCAPRRATRSAPRTPRGLSGKTLKRLAILLAAQPPEGVARLEDLDDALAAELMSAVHQTRAAGWSGDALAEMVEQALRSERHHTRGRARRSGRGAAPRSRASASPGHPNRSFAAIWFERRVLRL